MIIIVKTTIILLLSNDAANKQENGRLEVGLRRESERGVTLVLWCNG